jgi:Family of unknown function (DUF6292)
MDHREPLPHQVPRVNATRNYVTQSVRALLKQGLVVDRSWLDPADPRDATVVLTDTRALVWDEVTGWRVGLFRAGAPGIRTALEGAVHLGGGPLPTPAELSRRAGSGASAPRRQYRTYADSDGFDEVLLGY